MKKYYEMISTAAERAKREISQLGMAGVAVPFKLLYRTGELLLIPEYEEAPEGFRDSGKLLQPSVPYEQYARWIERNSGDLAIL